MDATRIFAKEVGEVRLDHRRRYEFASVQGRVLDAACGCGYGSKILMDKGCTVVGIDIERDAIEWARMYYPGPRYYMVDVEHMFPTKFDAVVSFETIEHLKNPEKALRNFREIAPYLVVSVPNEDRIPFKAEDYKTDSYPHRRHYTPDELEALLNKTGWAVHEKYTQTDKRGELSEIRPGTDGRFLVFTCIPS